MEEDPNFEPPPTLTFVKNMKYRSRYDHGFYKRLKWIIYNELEIPPLQMKLTVAEDFSLFYFTPFQRNLSEKLEDYASYLLIGEEETFDSNWIVEDKERVFHISLHYKCDR